MMIHYKKIEYIEIWNIPREVWEFIWRDMVGVEPVPGETTFALRGELLEKVRRFDLNDMPPHIFTYYLQFPSLDFYDHFILTVEKSQ